MKILFCCRPAYGHLFPLLPLALAARHAGHDVEFATAGGFVEKLRGLGFDAHDVGLTIEQASRRTVELVTGASGEMVPRRTDGRPDPHAGAIMFVDVLAQATARDLARLLPGIAPDLVIYESYDFGAAVVAHWAGLPAVCFGVSPGTADDSFNGDAHARTASLWERHGADHGGWDLFRGDAHVDIFPAALQRLQVRANPHRIALRPVAHREPSAAVPAWVPRCRRPVVYLTLGTVVSTDEALLPAISGLASLDVEVLLALGSAAGSALGTVPSNVHPVAFVDQASLMDRVALVVHHGGSGTMLAALASGTPQVVLPKGADQFFNGDALTAADLATVLEPSEATADAIAAAAKIALTEDRPGVEAARREIAAMPPPGEVVAQLVARFG